MARTVHNSHVSQTFSVDTRTETSEMTGGATGQITKAISKRRSHRKQWRVFECVLMIILDALMLNAAFYLAYAIRFDLLGNSPWLTQLHLIFNDRGTIQPRPFDYYVPLAMVFVIGLIVIFALRRLYHLRLTGSWFRQAWIITLSSTIGIALLIAYNFVFQYSTKSIIDLPQSRLLIRMGLGETRLLVVGSGRLGKLVMQHIAANPNLGYAIVGFLHDLNEPPGDFGRFKMLGTIEDIGPVIRSMQIDEVIIALPAQMHQQAIRSVKLCERLGTSFKLIPDLYELNLSRIDMDAIEGIPLINIKQVSLNIWQGFITRLIDITVSASVLILGLPLWIFLALAIALSSPGPIIYKQTRIGLNGRAFQIHKFRSMYKDADQRLAQLLSQNEARGPLFKMKNDPRVTPIGKFLRSTSLDEIPQFINILKGDMSLVGPRPALPREVAQYEEWQKGRLAIKPGLTGLWQVRGRSNLTFDEGVLMDLYYIENWSLRLHIQILLRTIPAVLFSRGAY
jgi:exopolysaccharide biosynthesis polyprenyl glycosylphosphotransferase